MEKGPRRDREAIAAPGDTQGSIGQHSAGDRPVGIKDIAKALGISIGTVDRALHSRSGINPMTRDRVLKMARTLGYKPNLAARYLKAPRQIRLSVNLPSKIASFFDAVRTGIRDAASPFEAGVDLAFRSHPALGEGDEQIFQAALEDGSRGIIIAPGNPAQLRAWIRRAGQQNVPVVCVATDAPGTERLTSVSADPFTSGAIAGELFYRMTDDVGSIVVMTGDLSTFDHAEKVRGFKSSLALLKSSLDLSSVLESHDDETAAYLQTRKLLSRDRHLKAIYVSTANSLGVIRALDEADAERRIQLITTDLFAEMIPHLQSGRILATIYQRPETQGRLAFESLYGYLVEGKCPPARIRLNPHIVMRSNLDLFRDRIAAQTERNRQEQRA